MKLKKLAGWWRVNDPAAGGIDWSRAEESEAGMANALPGSDDENAIYNGDGPADVMGAALDNISEQYIEIWGRAPKNEELEAVFNFCMGTRR